MKKVLLDTNFIISCLKQKISFFDDLKFLGFEIVIPKQVMRELEGLKLSESAIALKLLNKYNFTQIDIGKGHVDKKIELYVKKHPEILVATLDKELQRNLKNNIIIIKNKKKLEIV